MQRFQNFYSNITAEPLQDFTHISGNNNNRSTLNALRITLVKSKQKVKKNTLRVNIFVKDTISHYKYRDRFVDIILYRENNYSELSFIL